VLEQSIGGNSKYKYGDLDYIGNIWEIDESESFFDAILCTEVLEHLPYPNETIKEFARLTRREGFLILTAPTYSLKHMDPYHFYTGFTDRWYEYILEQYGFEIMELTPISDYYKILSLELTRIISIKGIFSALLLLPAFAYLYLQEKSKLSTDTLCYGYHILAKKL
jgi:SAM-dependent methyltransferase